VLLNFIMSTTDTPMAPTPTPKDDIWDTPSSPSSNMTSMDCWDYTVELECLQGPQGCSPFNSMQLINFSLTYTYIEIY